MDKFSIGELSIAVVSILAAIGLCLRGSKCTKITTPFCNIERDLEADTEPLEIENP